MSVVVAVLLEAVGSETADPTVTELVITVPGAVPALTLKTKVNVELAFAAIEGLEQETVVAFTTQVVARPAGGTFPISLQVTDNLGDVVNLSNVAPVTVTGSTPGPSPTAGATSTPTASPSAH